MAVLQTKAIPAAFFKSKETKIGRRFWTTEEDDCLKQGLKKYGQDTKNRWAKIKSIFFAEQSFHTLRLA